MFLNLKKDIKTIKDFGMTFKEKAPFLVSFIKVIFIIIKWVIILFIVFLIITLVIELYTKYQEYKYQKLLSEPQANYQKCLDKTVEINGLKQKWKEMKGWREWRCGAYWELYWVDWIVTEHSELCSDYDLNSIRFFLNERMQNIESIVKSRLCPPDYNRFNL